MSDDELVPAPMQRARQPKQKEQRRETLLAAALELYLGGNGDLPKVEAITKKCGLAKGTAYIYFNSKEEIYLSLYEQQLTSWLQGIQKALRRTDTTAASSLSQLVGALHCWEQDQPNLWSLAVQSQPVLEPAVDSKVLLAYRSRITQQFKQTAEKIQTFLAVPPGQSALPSLLQCYAVMLGCWPLNKPPVALSRVMQSAGSANMQLPFKATTSKLCEQIWQAYMAAHQTAPKASKSSWFSRSNSR